MRSDAPLATADGDRARRGPGRRRRRRSPSAGSVTAETALALPVLVVVLAAALGAVRVATAQLRCVDAAREAARAVARGDAPAAARLAASRDAPPGARVAVRVDGSEVSVQVTADVSAGPLLRSWPVAATAVTDVEPGGPSP